MKKNRQIIRLQSVVLALLLTLFTPLPVSAAGTSRMMLRTAEDSYEKGSIVTAEIYIYDAEFNAAGFSLQYNTKRMTPVTGDGTTSDKPGKVIRLKDPYDENAEAGTFSMLDRTLDTSKGTITAVFYVNPKAGKTASGDQNGMLVAELSFQMLEAGEPDVKFAVVKDSADFYAVPCLMVNNGSQMETAEAEVQYGGISVQKEDVSKPVIEKADAAEKENSSDPKAQEADEEAGEETADGSDKPKKEESSTNNASGEASQKPSDQKENPDTSGEIQDKDGEQTLKGESIEEAGKEIENKKKDKQKKDSYTKCASAGLILVAAAGAGIIYYRKKKTNNK